MPLLPLRIEPGLFKNGTLYQARSRWYSANFIRFYENAIRPIGGWQPITANTGVDPTESGFANPISNGTALTDFTPSGAASVWEAVEKSAAADTPFAEATITGSDTATFSVNLGDLGSLTGMAAATLSYRYRAVGAPDPFTIKLIRTSDDTVLWTSGLQVPVPMFQTLALDVDMTDIEADTDDLSVLVEYTVTAPFATTFQVAWVRLSRYGFVPEDITFTVTP